MSLAEKIQTLSEQNAEKSANNITISENVPKVYEAGKINFGRKKSVSGEALHIDDINPNEHKVNVLLEKENLFDINGSLTDSIDSTGGVVSLTEDGKIKSTANFASSRGSGQLIDALPNMTYTLSYTVDTMSSGVTATILQVLSVDTNNKLTVLWLSPYDVKSIGKYKATFTTPADTKQLLLSFNGMIDTTYSISGYTIYDEVRLEIATDVSTVNVTACGKNLFDIENAIADTDYLIVDGIVESTCATWVSARLFKNDTKFYIPKGTYRISADVYKTSEKVQTLGVRLSVAINNSISETYAQSAGKNLTNYDTWERLTAPIVIENDSLFTGILIQSTGTSGTDKDCGLFFKNVQIEYADTSTPYELYNGTTYTPNADGTIEGVTSISPIMNIFTDTTGVVINAEYYQDVERFNEDSEYDRIWEAIQENGARRYYFAGFANWIDAAFYPKYDIVPLSSCSMMFQSCTIVDFVQRCKDCGITIDFSQATTTGEMFAYNKVLERVGIVDTSSSNNVIYMFCNCNALKEVEKLVLSPTTNSEYTKMFQNCYALEKIIVEGAILRNFDIHWSTKLTKESITSIVNILSDDATGQTLSLSSTAVTNAFGSTTADEWTALVATKQNWTISLV